MAVIAHQSTEGPSWSNTFLIMCYCLHIVVLGCLVQIIPSLLGHAVVLYL